jgi:hypothetical protein
VGEETSICWLQDVNQPGETITNAEVTIVVAPGLYSVEFFDTWNGNWVSSIQLQCSEWLLTIPFADFQKDLAAKIHREATVDLKRDGIIDFGDFAIFSQSWLDTNCGSCNRTDLTGDGDVDWEDLGIFAFYWLSYPSTDVPTDIINPSFEDNAGSLDGWQIVYQGSGNGPDNPPWSDGAFGVTTPFGDYFAGKITNWLTMDFYMGQILKVKDYYPQCSQVDWSFSAYVNLHSQHISGPTPGNVHQVWEIGWKDDGSLPEDITDCDNFLTIADIDGDYTGNDPYNFYQLSAQDTLEQVEQLQYVVIRVHMYNDNGVEWTKNNMDNISFEAACD